MKFAPICALWLKSRCKRGTCFTKRRSSWYKKNQTLEAHKFEPFNMYKNMKTKNGLLSDCSKNRLPEIFFEFSLQKSWDDQVLKRICINLSPPLLRVQIGDSDPFLCVTFFRMDCNYVELTTYGLITWHLVRNTRIKWRASASVCIQHERGPKLINKFKNNRWGAQTAQSV
jgi:hypothetical protein